MQAVIMAGGKGTRLASVARDIPKPMARVAGKPLLEHQIVQLRESGIRDIVLVIGYLGGVIREYFQDGSSFGVDITYFEETEPLGTAGALRCLQPELEEDFFLVFGDLYFDINFSGFLAYHRQTGAAVTLFAHPNSHPYDSDLLATDGTGRVTAWNAKNEPRDRDHMNLVNAGLYVIRREALDALPAEKKIDLEKHFIRQLIPGGTVYAYRSTEYVKDMGTPERLQAVERDIRGGICQKRNLRNLQKCIFLDRDGTINKFVGFLTRPDQMELEPGAAEAIRLINGSEYLAVVVTNQPVVARGECTFKTLEQIHARMHTLLGAEGAYIDDLYYCPHHPDKGFAGEVPELKIVCGCRKPQTGLLERAVREHNIDLKNSWVVGDTDMDVQTGVNAGTKTALVLTGDERKRKKYDAAPDLVARDLLECVTEILRRDTDAGKDKNLS